MAWMRFRNIFRVHVPVFGGYTFLTAIRVFKQVQRSLETKAEIESIRNKQEGWKIV